LTAPKGLAFLRVPSPDSRSARTATIGTTLGICVTWVPGSTHIRPRRRGVHHHAIRVRRCDGSSAPPGTASARRNHEDARVLRSVTGQLIETIADGGVSIAVEIAARLPVIEVLSRSV
jgi:hypothetical protein